MTAPHVLFVNHASAMGGAEFVLLDVVRSSPNASAFLFEEGPLAPALEAKGLTVFISRFGAGLSRVRRDGSLMKALPLAWRLVAITAELARLARKHTLLYANSQKAFVLAAFASMLARRPLVWHLHDIVDATHFGQGQRRLQIALANRFATRVIVPSQAAATAFVAAGGRRDRVEVVPNGIDVDPQARSKADLRKAMGLPDGPLVGVFSRLAPWKGQHILLEALAELPSARCIVVGAPLFGEQAYADSLTALVEKLGLGDRVRFLGHRADVVDLMRAVDVVVHPSVDPEPFGRTLVEAMLAGTPVIATDTGAAPEILEAGAAGTLVSPRDPAALARAIAHVLALPRDVAAKLDYAAARAKTHYGAAKMREAIAAMLGRVAMDAHA
ncbi:MAG: glycosyltransferase [Methylovirgula sp.]